MMAILSGRLRAAVSALSAALVSACSLAFAQTTAARFDLTGPRIDIRVTRDGKTLPIAAVPNLKPGDKIWLFPDLPRTQSVHYLLVAVFLRGTTNPPPTDWFTRVETWNKKVREEGVTITVPAEAQQAILFLAPETAATSAPFAPPSRDAPESSSAPPRTSPRLASSRPASRSTSTPSARPLPATPRPC